MRIGHVAAEAGLPTRTIRYYERLGLLPPARRAANGYRDYDDDALDRLAFIRAAQSDGFTLGEIYRIIAVRDGGHAPCAQVRALVDQHAVDIDRRIAELRQLRLELTRLAACAESLDPAACRPEAVCEIITGPNRRHRRGSRDLDHAGNVMAR
jgi:MerR family transcriptional regulator, copper efflux regulator